MKLAIGIGVILINNGNIQKQIEVDCRSQLGNVGLFAHLNKINETIYYTAVTQKEKLDVTNSKDVVFHSASRMLQVLAILLEGNVKSLGALRKQHGQDLPRETDNKGGGKRHDQEIHQIYFNPLS